MIDINLNNLDPQKFVFWRPPADRVVHAGPEQRPVPLPSVLLPVKRKDMEEGAPSDHAIGEGIYDYLRAFPDCLDNTVYAQLLRDGFPHFLADLAAHAVMLDHKDVEPAYIYRKLTCLKILRLLEPDNIGLLWQLCQGFYGLAMTFAELPQVRRHLLEAMGFGQAVLKHQADHVGALNLLAEIDLLFGDYPTAINRFERLLEQVGDEAQAAQIVRRRDACLQQGLPDHPLVDDLEKIAAAMQLYGAGNYLLATEILERLEEDAYFLAELKSADYLCLLGMCRVKNGDPAGAFDALTQALELDPQHEQAREALDAI